MRILIVGGIAESLLNFRGQLIREMLEQGHEVLVCAGDRQQVVVDTLQGWGVPFVQVTLERAGMRPLQDLRTLVELRRLMRDACPDAVLLYTIKPVVWGGLAAGMLGIANVHSLITGLGYAFMARSSMKQKIAGWIAKKLYAFSLRGSRKVYFQNPDDRDFFLNLGLVKTAQAVVVNGSGIDLNYFAYSPVPAYDKQYAAGGAGPPSVRDEHYLQNVVMDNQPGSTTAIPRRQGEPKPIRFLLIARLLRDKGICEYAAAADSIRLRFGDLAEFHLIGDYDPNPAGLKPVEIKRWTESGLLIYHGRQNDVRRHLVQAHVYVLPSYREGTPRTVLEAMATGRAIITTDVPGCRETVRLHKSDQEREQGNERIMEGENGFLVPPYDAGALAIAMLRFLDDPHLISTMGKRSRDLVMEKYDVRKVNAVMLESMDLSKRTDAAGTASAH